MTALAGGAGDSANTGVAIPSGTPAGTYVLGAIADTQDEVLEGDETNNRFAGSTIVIETGSGTPDLLMTAVSGPASAVAGSAITLSYTVRNDGTAGSGGFFVGLYVSPDATLTTADTRVGSAWVPVLASGAVNSASPSATLPAALAGGTYYLGAIADADGYVSERVETNNALTGGTILVTKPDLITTAVSAPSGAGPGTTVFVSNTVKNQGDGAASAFAVGFYLSTDAVITTADPRAGTRSLTGLAAGGSSGATTSVVVPSTLVPGTYTVGAIADYAGAVFETNETNNARTGNTVTVTTGADLVMTAVSSGSVGWRGTTLTISNTARNQGTGAATGAYVGLYLSTDAVITTSDIFLGNRFVTLGAGASSSAFSVTTIPTSIAPGTYFVGAIADYTALAAETNETNNARAGNTILINP